jgi:hypothetical protein
MELVMELGMLHPYHSFRDSTKKRDVMTTQQTMRTCKRNRNHRSRLTQTQTFQILKNLVVLLRVQQNPLKPRQTQVSVNT